MREHKVRCTKCYELIGFKSDTNLIYTSKNGKGKLAGKYYDPGLSLHTGCSLHGSPGPARLRAMFPIGGRRHD